MRITYDISTFPQCTLTVIPENRFEESMIRQWVKDVNAGESRLSDLGEIIKPKTEKP